MRRSSVDPPMPLLPRQKAFAEAYVVEKSGTAAARLAGYSARSARLQGHRLLRREDVRAYIETLKHELEAQRAEIASRPDLTPQFVTERYRRMAMVSPADLMVREGDSWRQKRPDELTEDERAAISEAKIVTPKKGKGEVVAEQQFAYRLHSRKDALDSLSRVLGMNKATVQHSGAVDVRALFQVAAAAPERSETSARLRARYGNAGARIVDETPARPHSHTSPVPLKRW